MTKSLWKRAYVINLVRRQDRLRTFRERLAACDWPINWPKPETYPGIEGDVVGVPDEFTQGGGAYGCRMSHLRILQDCLMGGVGSVLVLEDDADLLPGLGPKMETFASQVPGDWEGIMLGGQHHAPPEQLPDRDGVVRVTYAQRTHAYVARGRYLQDLQRRWGNCTQHIDWAMQGWQRDYRVYAPSRWLIGQGGGRSDIRGAEKPPEWWNEPDGNEPVVILRCSRPVMETLRGRGFHTGFTRDHETGYDVKLPLCLEGGGAREPKQRQIKLRDWLTVLQGECVSGSLVCTVWHPAARIEDVQAAWSGPVVEITAETADDAEKQLPDAWRERLQSSANVNLPPAVLLRCPRPVMESLREQGFHTGHWRDIATGYDRGLAEIIETMDSREWPTKLAAWFDVLDAEARRDGQVVTFWHPDVTEKIARAAIGRRRLLVIEAGSVSEAIAKWREK
jgi:hypothetical protein